jgi:Mg-chelatase subunit ChlD
VGPAGVYLSRNVEIFRLYEDGGNGKGKVEEAPMFVGPTGHVYAGFLRRVVFYLDVPANGNVQAGMNHCYFQGYVGIDDPDARPAQGRLVGALDAAELEGPGYPLRVAAGEELAVLLGRMDIYGVRPDQQYRLTNYTTEAQTVQRWGLAAPVPQGGRLSSQVGLCPDADIWYGSDNWLTRDVAIDGRDVYTIDPELLQLRPDDGWPAWTYWPGFLLDDPDQSSFLGAASADDGRVAVLDLGAGSVVLVDRDGQLIESWSADAGGAVGSAVDLALDGDRLYLADQARGQVVVTDLQGRVRDSWPTHDGPLAIDIGPTGDVLLLGRGGFGFHYSPSGTLLASWAMPDRGAQARDIAIGDDGRVYVNFLSLDTPLQVGSTIYTNITSAGVWVFERTGRPLGPPPPTQACVPRPDKWAGPRRIPLGDTVDVTLTVDGWCPGSHDEAQIVFVVDTSRSMLLRDSLGQGKSAMMDMIDGLDPSRVEVGLVTFDFGPTLREPLTRDLSAVRTSIAALEADGDTQLGGALGSAFAELTGERGNPEAKRAIVLITDGVFKDAPDTFPPAVRLDIMDAGIDLQAVVFPSWEYRPDHQQMIELLVGDPGRVFVQPEPGTVRSLTDILTGYQPEEGLFETITIVDKVPDNMTYIEDSAQPFATWDPGERTLTWRFGVTPGWRQLEMTYTLRPQQVGIWPTNVWARGPYRDALGNDGQVVFPIPEVEVFDLAYRVYLPYGFTCPKPRRADIALVLDASSSMLEPAAGGGTKIEAAREAAGAFLDAVSLGGDRVSVVEFGADARVVTPLTADRKQLEAGLNALAPSLDRQGTRIDLGLSQAHEALRQRRADALPVVILLTDGLQTNPPGPDAVRTVRDALLVDVPEALVYTIGLGESVDGPLLIELAGARQRSFLSPSTADLRAIYGEISERLGCE